MPFTVVIGARRRVQPERLLAAVREGGGEDDENCLELSFRERKPNDRGAIAHIAESVAFWAPHVDTGAQDPRA